MERDPSTQRGMKVTGSGKYSSQINMYLQKSFETSFKFEDTVKWKLIICLEHIKTIYFFRIGYDIDALFRTHNEETKNIDDIFFTVISYDGMLCHE